MRKATLLLAGLLGAAIGCIGPAHLPQARMVTAAAEPAIRKNYVLGVAKTVAAGESVASVSYRLKVSRYPNFILLRQAITLKTEKRMLNLPNGRILTFIGPVKLETGNVMAYGDIHTDEGLGEFYYVTPDLTLAGFVYIKDRQVFPTGMERILSTWPERVRFKAAGVAEEEIRGDRPDHDILFEGKDAGGIRLTFLEHAPDGSIDPAGVRRLTFRPGSTDLQCQGTRIQVEACTETTLVATVVED